ncbi:MAG: hypothetical protein WCL29_06510 [Pseudomonadota bacterium]
MSQPLAPIRVQFAKAGNYYRLEVSISRLLPRELPLVISAFTESWTKPEEVERVSVGRTSGEALAVTLMADHEIRAGERPTDIARNLTYAIWQMLDRYVKVTVETTYLGESPDAHFEFGEAEYANAFGTRFEN